MNANTREKGVREYVIQTRVCFHYFCLHCSVSHIITLCVESYAKSIHHQCSFELNNLMYFLLSFLLMRSFLRIIILYSLDNVKFNLNDNWDINVVGVDAWLFF